MNWAEIEGLQNPNSFSEKDFGLNANIAKSVQDNLETCAMSLGACIVILYVKILFLSFILPYLPTAFLRAFFLSSFLFPSILPSFLPSFPPAFFLSFSLSFSLSFFISFVLSYSVYIFIRNSSCDFSNVTYFQTSYFSVSSLKDFSGQKNIALVGGVALNRYCKWHLKGKIFNGMDFEGRIVDENKR